MNGVRKLDSIENIFQKEAKNYDDTIKRIIPFYDEMLRTLVDVIPFPSEKKINVIDLGCGTGTLALILKQKYPNAIIKCLDVAEDMVNIAKEKLKSYSNIEFQVEDLHNYEFNQNFDVIISSLALHHLHGDDQKKKFFQKIFSHLNPGGNFFNLDVAIGSNEKLEEIYVSRWIDFMKNNFSLEQINNELLPKYYHKEIPTQLLRQINWLSELGFTDVEIIWKYYHFVMYCGSKSIIELMN